MNTFEYYYAHFNTFEKKITSWKPDYIVPVAKKGCKLLRTSSKTGEIDPLLIKYKSYFELHNISVKGKKISVVDDATQYTSTLQEYRTFFENLGGTVRTFSFVGHENLYDGKKLRYDEKAEIEYFLPAPVYQEYILQQSYYLLENGTHYDLDHLIFEVDLPKEIFTSFLSELKTIGLLLRLDNYFLKQNTERFSLIFPSFFNKIPFLSDESVKLGQILKIKFTYNAEAQKLYFSPLVFPVWNYTNTNLKKSSFCNVPFELPFDIPSSYSSENKETLLRIYYNLQFAYTVGFAKALLQEISSFNLSSSLKIKRDDLNAILEIDDTLNFIESLEKYLCDTKEQNFFEKNDLQEMPIVRRSCFKSFGEVLDYLKSNYEKKCKKSKKRMGIHYYLSYEKLFSKYQDKISLSEDLDYYCDFGVVVPETLIKGGKIQRYCRTGEPEHELSWKRTQVLIPLVIDQYMREFNTDSIEPMLLIKLFSNFIFDYPNEHHYELHCFIGKPYTFGTMIHVYHRHRASSQPNIYSSKRVSPYYRFDNERKRFFVVDLPEVRKKVNNLFDERQEVPYSEIIIYFKLLLRIYKRFENVDVLNMLSICRDENYFYPHVLYNINMWIENYGNFLDTSNLTEKKKLLHETGTQANSVLQKIRLAERLEKELLTIKNEFEADLEFLKAIDKIFKYCIKFSNAFNGTFQKLKQIIELELILTTLSLYHYEKEKKYTNHLDKHEAIKKLAKHSVKIPNNFHFESEEEFLEIAKRIYIGIKKVVHLLPLEENHLLSARLKGMQDERAKNIATTFVYTNGLSEATILYVDFSGLKNIPEPKEAIISLYYNIVEKNTSDRGHKLCGGKGGDDAFSYIFDNIFQAIQCAKDIKKNFRRNIFLGTSNDIKFGLCSTMLPDDKKENDIIKCWGLAKACCEFKGRLYHNRGHLIISQETNDLLISTESELVEHFVKIDGEVLKNDNSSPIYRFSGIEPIEQ